MSRPSSIGNLKRHSFKARYLFPIDQEPIPDGVVEVEGDRIVALGKGATSYAEDLGNVALLPALINCHTHLEFSGLDKPIGFPGQSFADWIHAVVRHRRAELQQSDAIERRATALQRGVAESLAAGCTVLAEIATAPWDPWSQEAIGKTEAIVFLECLGLSEVRGRDALQQVRQFLDRPGSPDRPRYGLSPHAPYTVHPIVLQSAVELSKERRLPVAMHLAESMQELELLSSASGPLVELLCELDAWDPSAIPRGIRPLQYLKWLAQAPRSLVVHGNYLAHPELEYIAARQTMTVIYCPRTHAYFGHAQYPLAEMLELGVRVALGTDSRASNPDLNMLSELRFAAARHPAIPASRILELATKNAANALGLRDQGSLHPGYRAQFVVVRLPERDGEPHELLLDSSEPVVRVLR